MKKPKRPDTGFRRALLLLVPILIACGIIAAIEFSKPDPVSHTEYAPMVRESGMTAAETPSPAPLSAETPVSTPQTGDVPASSLQTSETPASTPQAEIIDQSDAVIAGLYDAHESDVQVRGTGTVIRILSDDTDGDRHQRFIIELNSGQTLLVAHNIDITARLDGLQKGDTVSFYGEYVYNDEGGLIHWTHRDPDGSHKDGWLRWNGQVYQ